MADKPKTKRQIPHREAEGEEKLRGFPLVLKERCDFIRDVYFTHQGIPVLALDFDKLWERYVWEQLKREAN